ncbi:MAG TPA: hypothetical protein P5244_12645, partial [Syntrophales bacterium]|nr:hypothetical protein [Syntrophales bacterium]
GHRGGRSNPKKEGPEERVVATLYSGQLESLVGSISVIFVLCDETVLRLFRNLCSRARTLPGCRSNWHSQTMITRQPRRRRRRTCRRSLASFRANFSVQYFRWVLGVGAKWAW